MWPWLVRPSCWPCGRRWSGDNNPPFSGDENISICNAKNNDKRLPQICLGSPYNWHVLDKIVRHNRPRKEKKRFVDKYGGDCVSTRSGEADCFAAKKFSFAPQICGEKCVFAPQNYFGIWKLVLLLSNNRDIIVVFLSPCPRLSLEKVENSPC